tara:strand:+ start:252 stop:542 length:291 start_codon:yes stop_codon:yes gene_type:complete
MNPLTAPAGTVFRVRMNEGATSDAPRDYWEEEAVTVEDDDAWDTTWHEGSRRVSRASFPTGLRRVYGIWSELDESDSGAIGWSGNWIVGVHEYKLA